MSEQDTSTITATLVTATPSGRFSGDARLYRLSAPVSHEEGVTEYVIVSAADVMFSGPETYIFPADADGNVISWLGMPGSFRGAADHEEALRRAGWAVAS